MSQPGARTACVRRRRATKYGHCRRLGGFTLVELMVTLFVAAILVAVAVPSFKHITVSSRLTTAANSVVSALNTARMEAIKRNATAQFCSNVDGANGTDALGNACGSQAGAVYVLTGATGAQVATSVLAPLSAVQNGQQLVGNMVAIRFDPQGLAHSALAATPAPPYDGTIANICSTRISSKNHRLVKMTAGSILAVSSSSGACP